MRLRNGKGVENGRELVFENVGKSWNSWDGEGSVPKKALQSSVAMGRLSQVGPTLAGL